MILVLPVDVLVIFLNRLFGIVAFGVELAGELGAVPFMLVCDELDGNRPAGSGRNLERLSDSIVILWAWFVSLGGNEFDHSSRL